MYLKATLLLVMIGICSSSMAQQFQITTEDNKPIPYANVFFPILRTGTATDSLGQFMIEESRADLLIQISAIGYKTINITYGDLNPENSIKMYAAHMEKDEVIVSAPAAKLNGETVMNIIGVRLISGVNSEAMSLPDKLATIPGVSSTSTGIGIGKPTVRGLSGNRVAVFSQGVRLENQQWGEEHGLGLDANGYEQVEVIKGPASLLYGSDAIGGVLYFVDSRYAKRNTIETGLNSQFFSNTLGLRNAAHFKLSKGKFHWNLFGSHSNHQDYSDGNGEHVENSRFNTSDIKSTFGLITEKWSGALRYNFLMENYGLSENHDHEEEEETGPRILHEPFQVLKTHIASFENAFFLPKSVLKLTLGYIHNHRQEFEEHEEDTAAIEEEEHAALDMLLNTVSYNGKWIKKFDRTKWELIAGSQGMYQWNKNQGEELLIPDASTVDFGVFAVTNLSYTKHSLWQLGVRYDLRSIRSNQVDNPGDEHFKPALNRTFSSFNFSTGLNHQFLPELRTRISLASGFRAPNTFELLSNGEHHGAFRYEIGNTNLKSENAYQVDISLDYTGEYFEVFINPFFSYIRNFIYLNPADSLIDDLPVFSYDQQNAMLFGGEAGLHIHPHPIDWLHLRWNYSNVYGQLTSGENLPLIPAQKLTTNLRSNFQLKRVVKSISAFVQHDYNFFQNNTAAFESGTPDYHLLSAGFEVEFAIKRQVIIIGLNGSNLLNTAYYDHLSRYKKSEQKNIGRNFTVSLRIPLSFAMKSFNK